MSLVVAAVAAPHFLDFLGRLFLEPLLAEPWRKPGMFAPDCIFRASCTGNAGKVTLSTWPLDSHILDRIVPAPNKWEHMAVDAEPGTQAWASSCGHHKPCRMEFV